ncbi:MAG TPA: polysaccharide pyruvyl transferase CsaB [Clostridia bacterium]|nr:polysaccharide pyruvyl transferase CsaB [Clostridia bacterium]
MLSGYFGFGNAGDEAVLEASIQWLMRSVPDLQVVVLSASPEQTKRRFPMVEAYDRFNVLQVLRAIYEADLVLSGGGGLIQDVTSLRSLLYYLSVMASADFLGKPFIVFAQGFGPVRTSIGRFLTRLVVRRARLVTLRDEDSLKDLISIGVRRNNVRVTADPAFLLEPAPPERGRKILKSLGLDRKGDVKSAPLVAFSLRPWPRRYEPDPGWESPKCFAEVLDSVTEKTGARVVLVPLYPRQDTPLLQAVSESMKVPAPVANDLEDPRDVMALLGGVDLVVGMRLHSLIFAVCSGVPAMGISYDPKVERLLEELELPCINPKRHTPAYLEDTVTAVVGLLGRIEDFRGEQDGNGGQEDKAPLYLDENRTAILGAFPGGKSLGNLDKKALDDKVKNLKEKALLNFELVRDVLMAPQYSKGKDDR